MDVELSVLFTHDNGEEITRPAFWDGDNIWKVSFASPLDNGMWTFKTDCSNSSDKRLHGITGKIKSVPYEGNNPLVSNGLLQMSPGKRNVIHANGRPFLLTGDTPWSIPFRGTTESVLTYARDRKSKGFNAALLMSILPDRDAEGPRDRFSLGGFELAFEDIKEGNITKMNISYFQHLDSLINILIDHGIVPVYQPVFHGFGWKGKNILGKKMVPEEYAHYCRYLVARYGAKPAIWLVGGDGYGKEPGVKEGGEEIEKWDAYRQPTGIHYSPFDEHSTRPDAILHGNKSYQDADWLDFQWCQTGHSGKHLTHKVMKMYDNLPVKGVANGEPTYECMRAPDHAAGWWQGNEAWLQFTSGGTMGVVYGAAGLWQWKLFPDEQGWPAWADGIGLSWKEALKLEGSTYIGYFADIMKGYDIIDIQRRHDLAGGELLLAHPGKLYICYLPGGGSVSVTGVPQNLPYSWHNPRSGKAELQLLTASENFNAPDNNPWVLNIGEKTYD